MAAATQVLGRVQRLLLLAGRGRPGRLPDRLGEGDQIVRGRRRRAELALMPDQLPAPGRRQGAGMSLAEVIRVRLGKRRKRADNRGRVGVDVGQRGDGLAGTAVPGTTPW